MIEHISDTQVLGLVAIVLGAALVYLLTEEGF